MKTKYGTECGMALLLLTACVNNPSVNNQIVSLSDIGAVQLEMTSSVWPSSGTLRMDVSLPDFSDPDDCAVVEGLEARMEGRSAYEVQLGGYYNTFNEYSPFVPTRVCSDIVLSWDEDLAGFPMNETVALVFSDNGGELRLTIPNPWLAPTLTLVSPPDGVGGPGDTFTWTVDPVIGELLDTSVRFYLDDLDVFGGEAVSLVGNTLSVKIPEDIYADANEAFLYLLFDGQASQQGVHSTTLDLGVAKEFVVAIDDGG